MIGTFADSAEVPLAVGEHDGPVWDKRRIRIAGWAALVLWLAVVAALFASVAEPVRAEPGVLRLAIALAAAAGAGVAAAVHVRATVVTLLSALVAFGVSAGWTARDLRWLEGAGRNDGQAGLVWVDPALLVLMAFGVSLALVGIARSVLERTQGAE